MVLVEQDEVVGRLQLEGPQAVVAGGGHEQALLAFVPWCDGDAAEEEVLDVAEVAAKVLTEPDHMGAIYELAGPDVLTQVEVADRLSQVLDRPVRAEQIELNAWVEGARAADLSDYAVETLVKMFRYYESFGFWGNPNVLGWLLQRPPTTFRTFLERVRAGERF